MYHNEVFEFSNVISLLIIYVFSSENYWKYVNASTFLKKTKEIKKERKNTKNLRRGCNHPQGPYPWLQGDGRATHLVGMGVARSNEVAETTPIWPTV
jgi:hypothetical protein